MSERFDNPDAEIKRLRKINQALMARVEQMTNDAGDSFALFEETALLRRRAAAERDRLSHAIEQSGETVVITDPDGNILYANPAFERDSGYRREEALGQNPRLLQSGLHPQSFYEHMWETIGDKKQTWTGEITNRRKDGSLYTEFATISPVLDDRGQVLNYVAVKRDITKQKRAAEQLQQTNRDLQLATENACALARQAEAANRAKSEFLANMSHEIRTPMNGVVGMAQLLLDTELNAKQKKYLTVLYDSAMSLMALLDNILDLARIESGEMTLKVTHVDVRKMLDETIRSLIPEAEAKGLTISHSIAEPVPASLRGDAGRIRQVLRNLLANAIKFTLQGSVSCDVSLHVEEGNSAHGTSPRIRFAIQDTGIGIPEAARPNLFSKFYQVDASTTRQFGGTGLGLNVCRQLVEPKKSS